MMNEQDKEIWESIMVLATDAGNALAEASKLHGGNAGMVEHCRCEIMAQVVIVQNAVRQCGKHTCLGDVVAALNQLVARADDFCPALESTYFTAIRAANPVREQVWGEAFRSVCRIRDESRLLADTLERRQGGIVRKPKKLKLGFRDWMCDTRSGGTT